jgi:hypothetical protein
MLVFTEIVLAALVVLLLSNALIDVQFADALVLKVIVVPKAEVAVPQTACTRAL